MTTSILFHRLNLLDIDSYYHNGFFVGLATLLVCP